MTFFAWIIAVIFLVAGLGSMASGPLVAGLFFFLIGLIALPPLWSNLEKSGVQVPLWTRWVAAIVFLFLAGTSLPKQSATHGMTNTAAKPQPPNVSTAPSPPEKSSAIGTNTPIAAVPSNWNYNESTDAMRGKTTYFACVNSDNELNFDFPYGGGSTGQLCLRNSPKFGRDVILTIDKGQFTCSFEGCSVSVKFDHGSILSFGASESADGTTNTIFIHGYSKFEQEIRKSKSMIIEAQYYQEGAQQLTFTVSGFDWKH